MFRNGIWPLQSLLDLNAHFYHDFVGSQQFYENAALFSGSKGGL